MEIMGKDVDIWIVEVVCVASMKRFGFVKFFNDFDCICKQRWAYTDNWEGRGVLDNLKDYAVRALVNAVDHFGTVAYKLTDLLEQQTSDISSLELKISCRNQNQPAKMCRVISYNNLMQDKNIFSVNLIFILQVSMEEKLFPGIFLQILVLQVALLMHSHGNTEESEATKATAEAFHLLEAEKAVSSQPWTNLQSTRGAHTSSSTLHTFIMKDSMEISKPLSAFRSFDIHGHREIQRSPIRSKSMLKGIFGKNKSAK
ncbi:putative protein ABIL1 [Acorus calamus]|uniref:Uncharacterized protein n=1 Tax=Acorus calamus TaxID=4465 RepID=A0AAV9FTI2_ACOCL|nr:putative protein ABIL1 [Acorus calamus]